jgi:hypothetical protein
LNTRHLALLARSITVCAALFTPSVGAVVLDFETLADGRRSLALHSAVAEYAALGVTFSGGGEFPGQPVFRGWSSLSRFVAKKPEAGNRFLLSTFRQNPDAFLDIVLWFATPVSYAAGDVVFNPSVSAIATAYDAFDHVIDEEYFAPGSEAWIGGRFSFESKDGIARILLRTSIPEAQMGLDNLWFTPVPEPSSWCLLLAGIASMAIAARRPLRWRGRRAGSMVQLTR